MITIIDYGLGNLGSVKNALDRVGVGSMVSSSISDIERADGLILPGVGAAGEGMKNLKSRKLDRLIKKKISNGKPLLSICLGMQLMFSLSEEGNVNCLNIVEGNVRKFNTKLKVPQIGWNQVKVKDSPLFNNIQNSSYFYFVHSYYCDPLDKAVITGETDYQNKFCSSFERGKLFGVQFHPEKSGENGLQLLKNFTDIVYGNNTSN